MGATDGAKEQGLHHPAHGQNSLAATLIFLGAEYLVGFVAGYGIKQADRNLLLFQIGAAAFALVFLATGGQFRGGNVQKARSTHARSMSAIGFCNSCRLARKDP